MRQSTNVPNSNPRATDPLMQQITKEIRHRLPKATAVVFFGSRVAGFADAFSDYDVLVLLPDGLELDERKQIKQEIQSLFQDIKLDLLFGSERWLRSRLPFEPYYRFWRKESYTTYGKVSIKRFPPLATGAMKSYLGILKAEIDLAEAVDRRRGSRIALDALELLIEIDQGFKSDYSVRSTKETLNRLVGMNLIGKIRNPKSRLKEQDLRFLLRVARSKYRATKAMLEMLPETSSDRRWRKRCQAHSRANRSSNRRHSA